MEAFDEALKAATAAFMPLRGVWMVGEGERDGKPCIVVYSSHPPEPPGSIPPVFHGFPVVLKRDREATPQRY